MQLSALLRRPARVLLVGSSLTRLRDAEGRDVYDLAGLLDALTRSRGTRRVLAESVARDGACLEDHWDEGVVELKLRAGRWDWLVLQESRRRALERPEATKRDARRFVVRAAASGARAALLAPWPARGDAAAESLLSRLFSGLGEELAVPVIPAGEAWREAATRRPDAALYAADGEHAGPDGARLAACLVYRAIHGRPLPATALPEGAALLAAVEAAVSRGRGGPSE